MAAVTSAQQSRTSRSASASTSMPSMPSVPLMSARPSLARRVTGSMPAAASASPSAESPARSHTSPSPIRARAPWARGARSPLAPSEPCSRTTGVIPALSRARCRSTTLGPDPGVAHRQGAGPQQHHRPHHLVLDEVAHAGGVRADQRHLQLRRALRRDHGVGQRPEARRDAVHGLTAGHEPSTSSAERSMAARAESASRAGAAPRATATTSAALRPTPRTTISVASVPVARPGSIRPQVTAVACPPPEPEPLHGRLLSGDGVRKARHVATVGAWMLRTSW